MNVFRRINPLIAVIAVIAVIAAIIWVIVPHAGKKYVYADFPKTISVYKGSDVKILGVQVGKVDSVTPMGTFVRVKLSYDDTYKVPADAKAAVISPSIVGDRFVQLTPAYKGGAILADNAHLGLKRTATPLELDTIFGSINDLDVALGPQGANAPDKNGVGALTRLLDSTAKNFGGEGVQFNQSIKNLSKLTKTLADNKDQLFGASREIEQFVNTLAKNDGTVRKFAQSLSSGSSLLANDRQVLADALDNLSVALTDVRGYVHENRALLSRNINGLTSVSNTIVKDRQALAYTLKVGPVALNNLALAYDPTVGSLDTRMDIGQNVHELTTSPTALLCTILSGLPGVSCPASSSSSAASLSNPAVKKALKQVEANNAGSDQRTLPFGTAVHSTKPDYDPTLAGLVGVSK